MIFYKACLEIKLVDHVISWQEPKMMIVTALYVRPVKGLPSITNALWLGSLF